MLCKVSGSFTPQLLEEAVDERERHESLPLQLSRLNAALAKRVLSELPQRPCSDTTLLRAVRNCAEMGQGRLRLTVSRCIVHVRTYDGHRATQTAPLNQAFARLG